MLVYVPSLPKGQHIARGSVSGVGVLYLGAALVEFWALPGRSVPRTRD